MEQRQIVRNLADDIDVVNNFEDVRVIEKPENNQLAWTDVKSGIVYINTASDLFDDQELISHIEALLVHEAGHLDDRFEVPATADRIDKHREKLEELSEYLNYLYDMEIHYQYNVRGRITPKHQIRLRKMLSLLRARVVDKKKPDDLILAMVNPTTELQNKIREIVDNRDITIADKAELIDDLLDKKQRAMGKEGEKKGEGGDSFSGKEFTGIGKPEGDEDEEELGKSIKGDIEKEHNIEEAKRKLNSYGFSDRELDDYLRKEDTDEAIENIENLSDCFDTVLPVLNDLKSNTRTRETEDKTGTRFNGYKRLESLEELLGNLGEFMVTGRYDPQETSVSRYTRRKRRGLFIILRDTSGSVSHGKKAKAMRDITVALIKQAISRSHRLAVVDFHSKPEPIKDQQGNILTTDYNRLLLDSMKFKSGSTTILSKALDYINDLIVGNKLEDVPLNLYIITDSKVDDCSDVQFATQEKINANGIWLATRRVKGTFNHLLDRLNGKIYKVENRRKLIADIYKDYA